MSVEVSWFSALCDDDYRYLGVHDPDLKSSWAHCSSIPPQLTAWAMTAYCYLGYQLGIDSVAFAGGLRQLPSKSASWLWRCGELWCRNCATVSHVGSNACGRLSINIISSDIRAKHGF